MKKILIAFMLIGMLFNVANAKGVKIFDLKEQYFSQTMLKKGQDGYGKEAKYDLPKVIVTTDTRYNGYSYMYGLFTVDIKEPLNNWSVNIKKKNGIGYYTDNSFSSIRLTSDNGTNYFVVFSAGVIEINNKKFKVGNYQYQKMSVGIKSNKNIVYFKINGKTFLKTNSKDFGKLAKVEVELNSNNQDDELYALEIYKVK